MSMIPPLLRSDSYLQTFQIDKRSLGRCQRDESSSRTGMEESPRANTPRARPPI